MGRRLYSERRDLIEKSREAILSAVQIFNNPLMKFKSETFIVLAIIAWTYMLHAHFRSKRIEYRYFDKKSNRKRFVRNPDGSIRHWDLAECLGKEACPLDGDTKNNLRFLVGLRNQIEHGKVAGLDSYLSARYQACALNFNHYLKALHGRQFTLDNSLALSLQFAELDPDQSKMIKDKEELIPKEIIAYIAGFDRSLSDAEIESERFAYRLLFTRVLARRKGQADRVIEFLDPKSELAKSIAKEYWVKEQVERPKLSATQVIRRVRAAGFRDFGMHQHTMFWRAHDGKNPNNGFGTVVVKTWCWYENWPAYVVDTLAKDRAAAQQPPTN